MDLDNISIAWVNRNGKENMFETWDRITKVKSLEEMLDVAKKQNSGMLL